MSLANLKYLDTLPVEEYVARATVAFVTASLNDITWAGDTDGQGLNPLDLSAAAWAPVIASDVDEAWTDPADSPEAQVRNALENDRVVEIVELLGIGPNMFGDRLYYDQNGAGTGFWDVDFSRPEYGELSELIGLHPWGIKYWYSPRTDPNGENITLYVSR